MEMLMAQLTRTLTKRNHPRLHTHRLQLRRIELVRAPRQFLKVDPRVRHLAGVDLEDPGASGFVG